MLATACEELAPDAIALLYISASGKPTHPCLDMVQLLNKKFLYGYSLDINFTYRGELSGHCEVSGITACVEGFKTD